MIDRRVFGGVARGLVAALVVVLGAGCGSKGGGTASGSGAPAGSGASAAGAGSGASVAKALSPSLAAIAAGSWKDPGGGPDVKLVATPLDKCYGFKGYSMKLPEGMMKKEEITDIKEKTYEALDAFLYKVERNGESHYAGWWEKKLGKNTYRCNSLMTEKNIAFTFDFQRAVIELCATLQKAGL